MWDSGGYKEEHCQKHKHSFGLSIFSFMIGNIVLQIIILRETSIQLTGDQTVGKEQGVFHVQVIP